jgi:hypothetical protein
MANVQGRRHARKNRRHAGKINRKQAPEYEMRFIYDDDDYIWENHVIGRLPFKEPEEVEIVFHNDKLWQEERKSSKIHYLNFLKLDGPRA